MENQRTEPEEPAPRNIAFIVPAATPGSSGVGDYALRLAAALREKGCTAGVIAWNEPGIGDSETPRLASGNGPVPALLLPNDAPLEEKQSKALAWLEERSVDWLSLQFSVYGYDSRGMQKRLSAALLPLLEGRRLHLMFHEIWIGLSRSEGLKAWLTGWMQRRAVARMLRQLEPDLVQTNNPLYRQSLAKIGCESDLLPLFSNIPVAGKKSVERAHEQLRKGPGDYQQRDLAVVFFGSVHAELRVRATARLLRNLAQTTGRRLFLFHVGRAGTNHQEHFKSLLESLANATGGLFGPRDPESISGMLQVADLGISTTPWPLNGKSGTLAAMREHDLPVLVAAENWELRDGPTPAPAPDPRCFKLGTSAASLQLAIEAEPQPIERADLRVAGSFLAALDANEALRVSAHAPSRPADPGSGKGRAN